MANRKWWLVPAAVLGTTVLGLAGAGSLRGVWSAAAGDSSVAEHKDAAPAASADTRKADRAAIRANMQAFLQAFQAGDAARVASFWTADGELIEEDDTVHRGRTAIATAYREVFTPPAKRTIEIEADSLRFPSRDTAIEEGSVKVRVGQGDPTVRRYSVLHTREGGKWLMAVVREWAMKSADLRDLDWLIGTWVARRPDTEVRTTYEWLWDRSFIRASFTIRQKDRTLSGFQMIGTDVESGGLRSWTFESEGGFGEATWSRDGKSWVLDSAGRLTDGSILAAKIILTPKDRDSFTWQTVRRSLDGEELDDLPPVKVTRVEVKK
ncbi:MAG: SgcJ/EcaC family oxidoreductase [Gemmataceae bacterium]